MTDTSISNLNPSCRNTPSLGRLPVLRAVQHDSTNGILRGPCVCLKAQSLAGGTGVDGEQNGEQASGDIKPCPATYSD